MRQALKIHPDSPCSAATHIEVEVAWPHAGQLVLSYVLTGRIDGIRMPPVVAAGRGDALWQHTCFEAFLRAAPGAAYYEFNFSPSTQWAAYRFDSYRSGMRVATEIDAPAIAVAARPERYTLQASLQFERLPGLPPDAPWRLGLSALIEDMSGGMSYWALAHPPGKPDFHHAGAFAHEFSTTVQP
jgi:hypothetical protein